jgi:drug/metabolite transporter (DMT)-like permease
VRDLLKASELPLLWGLFFATTVYGHVALKFAVAGTVQNNYRQVLATATTSLWGASAVLAWSASCLLWALLLSRQELLSANSISSLRYVLICVAAWLWVGETIRWPQVIGIALIASGTWLVK